MLKAERFYRARTYRKYLLILYYKYVYFDVLHSLHVVCSLAGLIVYLTHFHFCTGIHIHAHAVVIICVCQIFIKESACLLTYL